MPFFWLRNPVSFPVRSKVILHLPVQMAIIGIEQYIFFSLLCLVTVFRSKYPFCEASRKTKSCPLWKNYDRVYFVRSVREFLFSKKTESLSFDCKDLCGIQPRQNPETLIPILILSINKGKLSLVAIIWQFAQNPKIQLVNPNSMIVTIQFSIEKIDYI